MRLTTALLFAALATPALADTPLSIEAFERMVTGKVMLHFLGSDEPYGAEEYLPGRRVRWAFADDTCMEGRYFAQDGFICFTYDADPSPICWHYIPDGQDLIARHDGQPAGDFDVLLRETPGPLACTGPDLGV